MFPKTSLAALLAAVPLTLLEPLSSPFAQVVTTTTLEGAVLGIDATPIPHAEIVVRSAGGDSTLSTIANAEGRFSFTNLEGEKVYGVTAYEKGGWASETLIVDIGANSNPPILLKIAGNMEPDQLF